MRGYPPKESQNKQYIRKKGDDDSEQLKKIIGIIQFQTMIKARKGKMKQNIIGSAVSICRA